MNSKENSIEPEVRLQANSKYETIEVKTNSENKELKDVEKHSQKHFLPNEQGNGQGKKSFPERIPAFGIFMMILSAVSYSLGSLIIKLLPQLHSLEVLFFR